MAEQTSQSRHEEDEVQGDPGILYFLDAKAPELSLRPDLLETEEPPPAVIYDFPSRRTERLVVDFNRHPVRDVSLSALALTSLGFAAGAAVRHRRHH